MGRAELITVNSRVWVPGSHLSQNVSLRGSSPVGPSLGHRHFGEPCDSAPTEAGMCPGQVVVPGRAVSGREEAVTLLLPSHTITSRAGKGEPGKGQDRVDRA